MSFRTSEPIEITFEDGATPAEGVRYHVGRYHSIFYPNREYAAKAAASRFPKLMIEGRLMVDIITAAKDVALAPRPLSPVVEAEIERGEAGKMCAVTEKKKRKAKAAAAEKDKPPALLW